MFIIWDNKIFLIMWLNLEKVQPLWNFHEIIGKYYFLSDYLVKPGDYFDVT